MNPLRTILYPTDFSMNAETALDVARSLARDHGAAWSLSMSRARRPWRTG